MHQILLLNCSYFPIQVISVNKAVRLLFKEKAEAINDKMETVYFDDLDFSDFPKVVRLTKYSGMPLSAKLSKKNVLKRDKYRCAYCGKVFPAKELTVDHIIPKSRGGKFTWDNLITSCVPCNNKKGSRTLEESRIKLLFQTRIPNKGEIINEIVSTNPSSIEIWSKFIPQQQR